MGHIGLLGPVTTYVQWPDVCIYKLVVTNKAPMLKLKADYEIGGQTDTQVFSRTARSNSLGCG